MRISQAKLMKSKRATPKDIAAARDAMARALKRFGGKSKEYRSAHGTYAAMLRGKSARSKANGTKASQSVSLIGGARVVRVPVIIEIIVRQEAA